LGEIAAVLERHRVLDSLAHRQDTPNRALVEQLQRRQNLVDMQRRVRALHPADLAFILESLPQDDRLLLWREIDARQAAETLVELDAAARRVAV
jgi:magnesium transporter